MIDPLAMPFVGAGVLAVCGYLLSHGRALRRGQDAWTEAVRVCGLRRNEMSGIFGFAATARSESFTLRGTLSLERDPGVVLLEVRIQTVTDRIGLAKPLQSVDSPGIVTSSEDIVIGEPRVDDRLIVTGEPLVVHALFDAETRAHLVRVVDRPLLRTLTLNGGRLSIQADARGFPETLGLVLALAERLADVPPVEERVAALAGDDPLPAVRLTCLRALMEERPRHAATRGALRAALADGDASVRLTAALSLRTEGREALLGLARGPDTADDMAARAIVALGAHLPPGDAEPVLERALRLGRYETVGACLDALAAHGAAHLAPVLRVLRGLSDTGVALAAGALGLSGTSEAEPPLLRALDHASPDIRAAVVRSLARVGTAASVPRLRALEPGSGPDLRRAMREAVAAIQSRLGGADRGQLALAPDAGELSLADDARGRVALPKAATMTRPPESE